VAAAVNNPQFGAGGADELFVPDLQDRIGPGLDFTEVGTSTFTTGLDGPRLLSPAEMAEARTASHAPVRVTVAAAGASGPGR
jgi:hypothetical protein